MPQFYKLPETASQITASWLTEVMRTTLPGITITKAEIVDVNNGASTKVRMRLEGTGGEIPKTVIVKGGFEPHSRVMVGMHTAEMRAYRDIIPSVKGNAPRCYFAGQEESGQALVILEDLLRRDVKFLSLLEPIGYELAAAYMDQLARIHAVWWDSPDIAPGGKFEGLVDSLEGRYEEYFMRLTEEENFRNYMALPRGAATPVILHDRHRMRKGLRALRDLYKTMPRTIVHGDMQLGNLYLDKDGTPGFLDWVSRRAPGLQDVTYFIIANLDLPNRRRWESALIQRYLDQLRVHGVKPTPFEETFEMYRREVLWGFFTWLLNASDFQPESKNTAACTRFAMAMLEHDTYRMLGV